MAGDTLRSSDPPYALVLAMYRPQQNGTYQLVPGSYYQLTVDEKPDPFFVQIYYLRAL